MKDEVMTTKTYRLLVKHDQRIAEIAKGSVLNKSETLMLLIELGLEQLDKSIVARKMLAGEFISDDDLKRAA
jgi:hypothetical protein